VQKHNIENNDMPVNNEEQLYCTVKRRQMEIFVSIVMRVTDYSFPWPWSWIFSSLMLPTAVECYQTRGTDCCETGFCSVAYVCEF
jgi:hypothetical protein